MLLDGVDDPVDAWVTADGLVLWVNEDDLVVFVGAVLVDPVAVEDAEIGAALADTLFGGRFERALVLELVHTLVHRLAYYVASVICPYCSRSTYCLHTVCSTLRHRLLPSTSPHSHAVDDIALLGLVSQAASLVRAGRTGSAVDDVELAELN